MNHNYVHIVVECPPVYYCSVRCRACLNHLGQMPVGFWAVLGRWAGRYSGALVQGGYGLVKCSWPLKICSIVVRHLRYVVLCTGVAFFREMRLKHGARRLVPPLPASALWRQERGGLQLRAPLQALCIAQNVSARVHSARAIGGIGPKLPPIQYTYALCICTYRLQPAHRRGVAAAGIARLLQRALRMLHSYSPDARRTFTNGVYPSLLKVK